MPQVANILVENAFVNQLKINNILSQIIDETLMEYKPFFEQIFNTPPIVPKAAVDDLTTVGFGPLTQKDEADDITFDDNLEGYKTRYTNVGYGSGYSLSHEYQINEQYGFTKRLTRQLAQAALRSADILAADIFNSGGSVNSTFLGTTGDGKALFATDHPSKYAGNMSNDAANAADIAVVSLQENITTFQEQKGNRGEDLDHEARIILVPNAAYWDAKEIITSPDRPDTAERARNVLMDENLQLKKWKRLTDTDTWFIGDSKENHHLNFRWREKPKTKGWIEEKSLNFLYRIFMMLSIGHSDWRGWRRVQGV
jgi:hypothetical protein